MANWTLATIIGAEDIGSEERYCVRTSVTGVQSIGRIKKPYSEPGGEESWSSIGAGLVGDDLIIFESGSVYNPGSGSSEKARVLRCPISGSAGVEAEYGVIVTEFDLEQDDFPSKPFVGGMVDGVGVISGGLDGNIYLASIYFDGGEPTFQSMHSAPNESDFSYAFGVSSIGSGQAQVFGATYAGEGSTIVQGADEPFTLNSNGVTFTPTRFIGSVRGASDFSDAMSEFEIGAASSAVVGFFTQTTGTTGFNSVGRYDVGPNAWHERTSGTTGLFFATESNAGKAAVIEYSISYVETDPDSITFTLNTISERSLGNPYTDALALIGIDPESCRLDTEAWVEELSAPVAPRFWTQLNQSTEVI